MRIVPFLGTVRRLRCHSAILHTGLRWSRGIHESESLLCEDSLHNHSRLLCTTFRKLPHMACSTFPQISRARESLPSNSSHTRVS